MLLHADPILVLLHIAINPNLGTVRS